MTTLLHYIQSIYIRFCYFFGKKASRPVSEINCIDDDLYIDYTISQCFQHDCNDELQALENMRLENYCDARDRELEEYWETGIKHDYTSQYIK